MSAMSELDLDRQIIEAMKEPADTAELQLERRIDFLVRELDEFCAMANNAETRDLIENEAIGIGQIQFRSALILKFLEAGKTPKLKMVKNHG